MKAMILAAGLGTRLIPYTRQTPKPLFTLNRQPVLDITIRRLLKAGCDAIIVNTHHLHEQIEAFVAGQDYAHRLQLRHEPQILGTGGAIGNIADLWAEGPLLVINGDIVCDIDPARVLAFHQEQACPVTMVMHDHPDFNTVWVDRCGFVQSFDAGRANPGQWHLMAFTGIHVVERRVLDFLPDAGFAGIIEAYEKMQSAGEQIKAMTISGHYWQDIGTPASYQKTAYDQMAPLAFATAFGHRPARPIDRQLMHGDGSDRRWYRLTCGAHRLVMVDHGIRVAPGPQEVDAYVAIGKHLYTRQIPVPRIWLHDNFAGLVFVEDLGDQHLQEVIHSLDLAHTMKLYRRVIDQWIVMAVEAGHGFDTAWTYQTPHYDADLILEKECRYFTEAFLQGYLGWTAPFNKFAVEFDLLAKGATNFSVQGFMHRDLQSRNIMIREDRLYFIDFQGGRLGPLQYDLASLLIDPYTALPAVCQGDLLGYATDALRRRHGIDPGQFTTGYRFCALTRNLQILGAFAFLSRVKGKTYFEAYIPRAVQTLRHNLAELQSAVLPELTAAAEQITQQINSGGGAPCNRSTL